MPKQTQSSASQEVSLTISTQTFFRLAVLIIGTFAFLIAIQKSAHALLLIFTALLLALALNSPVHYIASKIPGKKRGSRVIGTALSFLAVVSILGLFIASFTPPLIRQSKGLVDTAPQLVRDFRDQNSSTGKFIRQYKLEKQIDSFSNQLSAKINNGGGSAFSAVNRISSSLFSILTILVLTFMMLIEGPVWIKFFKSITPDKYRLAFDRVTTDMHNVIKGFVNGQVMLAAIAAILILPAILLLGISYPLALMLVVFICGLIPMVGHTIGAIIVTTVALFTSPAAAVIILLYYITYQQIENILFQPRIQANSTNMSPLLVFMSIIIGVGLGGLFGGIVAIPVAGCIRILFLEFLRTKKIISNQVFASTTGDTKE